MNNTVHLRMLLNLKSRTPDARERENNVRSGAEQEGRLEKLKPENEKDKASNKLQNPPVDHVEDGS